MITKFLDSIGIKTLLNKLKTIFATKKSVNTLKEETDIYITDVDYTEVAFETTEIVEL